MKLRAMVAAACVVGGAMTLLNAGCGSEDDPGCTSDAQCKGDRICSGGQCVSPQGGGGSGAAGPFGTGAMLGRGGKGTDAGAGGASPAERDALDAFMTALPGAYCEHLEACGLLGSEEVAECVGEAEAEVGTLEQCDALAVYYVEHRDELDPCLVGTEGNCDTDDFTDFCPAMADVDLEQICESAPVDPSGGSLTSVSARAVGAWTTVGSNCDSGTDVVSAYFLCPGGRIRGAGEIGNVTQLSCGTYTTSVATLDDCTDRYGCFDKVSATVTSTLILAGEEDVATGQPRALYLAPEGFLLEPVQCRDESAGLLTLQRVSGEVTDDYCVSDACPASGSSDGSYGSCGTDCDCGYCWYCESGQCRYGGEGPAGCYRGCSG